MGLLWRKILLRPCACIRDYTTVPAQILPAFRFIPRAYLSNIGFSPRRHRGHGEEFLFLGRYRETKIFRPEIFTRCTVWTNTLPAVGFQDQSLEKQTHHEFDLRGSFRLSVSPDRRKNESASPCPPCLSGEPDFARNEFSPKKAMKSKQLSRAFR
jgi:hypothetical protein